MAPNKPVQEWQKLQVRIENMFAGYFQNDIPGIEPKAQGTVNLLEMRTENRQKMPERVPDL